MKAEAVPTVTAAEMREVDRIMIDELHIALVQMMENAGSALAELAIRRFGLRTAAVLAGSGGNGGGGLVAARHLANRGVEVRVTPAARERDLDPVTAHQLDILQRMGVAVDTDPGRADLVIDALIGYSLRGDPEGRVAELIVWAGRGLAPVLALDVPSGLDATTGRAGSPCIRAAATLTLALPKTGLLRAREQVGRLFVADISVPPAVFRRVGIDVPDLFGEGTVVELT
jgi:NAD(P)H-hydrate epimerase